MESKQRLVCLITGGGTGIGLEAARQLTTLGHAVVIGVRSIDKAKAAVSSLSALGIDVDSVHVDVCDEESIRSAIHEVVVTHGRIDVLVNNEGVLLDDDVPALSVTADLVFETIDTNAVGPLRMIQAVAPFMQKQRFGRIVNVSSGMGQLSEMNGGYVGYRLSKVGLNAITRIFHDELHEYGILVNSMCPGWVRTAMGGDQAERSPAEGADTIIYLATLPNDGPSGAFFRDRMPISW